MVEKRQDKNRELRRLLWGLPCAVFLGESVICFFVHGLHETYSVWTEILVNSTMLLLVFFPCIYFLVIRPMADEIVRTNMAKEEAKLAHGELQILAQELQVAKESFHDIVGLSSNGILVTDAHGKICFANPAASRLFKRENSELVGSTFAIPMSVSDLSMEVDIVREEGDIGIGDMQICATEWNGHQATLISIIDVTGIREYERALKKTADELQKSNDRLQAALEQVKVLKEILPICVYCKKIRNDDGYWEQVENYISKHTDSEFSHGMCPECGEKAMQEVENFKKSRREKAEGKLEA